MLFAAQASHGAIRTVSSSALCHFRVGTVVAMKDKNGKTVQKANLPSKICLTCNKPFTWRACAPTFAACCCWHAAGMLPAAANMLLACHPYRFHY